LTFSLFLMSLCFRIFSYLFEPSLLMLIISIIAFTVIIILLGKIWSYIRKQAKIREPDIDEQIKLAQLEEAAKRAFLSYQKLLQQAHTVNTMTDTNEVTNVKR